MLGFHQRPGGNAAAGGDADGAKVASSVDSVPNDDTLISDDDLLPPRVALEHADTAVRIRAMDRILHESKDDKRVVEEDTEGESTQVALLRHVHVEDDVAVANKASSVLVEVMGSNPEAAYLSEIFINQLLSALEKRVHELRAIRKDQATKKKR